MRKRDELNDPTSCMNRARDTEWTFVLLGRDRAAPAAVQAWINARILLGKNKASDPQIVEAEKWIATVLNEQAAASLPRCGRCAINPVTDRTNEYCASCWEQVTRQEQ